MCSRQIIQLGTETVEIVWHRQSGQWQVQSPSRNKWPDEAERFLVVLPVFQVSWLSHITQGTGGGAGVHQRHLWTTNATTKIISNVNKRM
jgi:hypothetical protein